MSQAQDIAEALTVGLGLQSPMTVPGMIAFLDGYGIELDPMTASTRLRDILNRRKDLFEACGQEGRLKLYQLREHSERTPA